MARHPLARRRTSSPWRVSIGVVAALGCSAPATRPSAAGAGATMAATSQVELTPSLAAVFARVVRLPVMVQPSASVRGNPEYYKNFESTATDAQLAEARALAADCAGQIAEWRRGREAQAERAIPIAGLPYPYGDGREWTPESAQHTCEELERGVADAQAARARAVTSAATLARWTTLAKGDRADLVRRYGLPNDARTDARLQDRFWVFTRFVNRTQPCTVTYYFQQDTIERSEAEPATCFTAQPR